MPVNTTPETATLITSLPYSITEDPQGGSDSTYIPSCKASGYRKPLWFQFTPAAGQTAVGITFDGADGGSSYFPTLSVWTGTPPALTEALFVCFVYAHPVRQQLSLTPGVTYYFQFTDDSDDVVTESLEWSMELATAGDSPAGALFVANDTSNFPTAILDPDDGTVLRILGFPAFECADILPDGTMAVMAEDPTSDDLFIEAVRLYDAALAPITAVTSVVRVSQSFLSPIRTNGADLFYVASVIDGSTAVVVSTLTAAGVVGGTTWTLPANANLLSAMAPSRDDAILYYGGASLANSAIHRYDLVNDTALTDLVADAGSNTTIGRDMYVLADDTLLVVYYSSLTAREVRRYNTTTGTLLNTYALGTTLGSSPRIALGLDDPDTFWAMTFPTGTGVGATNRFQKFDVATESVLVTFDVLQKNAGANNATLYGPSQCCPLLVLPDAVTLGAAPTVTTITADTPGGQPSTSCSGTHLLITGTGFIEAGIQISVTLEGSPVTVTATSVTSTQISATVDGGFVSGIYCVTVTNSGSSPSNQVCAYVSCVAMPQGTVFPIRRLRRSPTISHDGARVFHERLQVECQPGVGTPTGQGVTPTIWVRWSDDGGNTWSNVRTMTPGTTGQYTQLMRLFALGSAYNRMYEFVCSDPVPWVFVQGWIDAKPGRF